MRVVLLTVLLWLSSMSLAEMEKPPDTDDLYQCKAISQAGVGGSSIRDSIVDAKSKALNDCMLFSPSPFSCHVVSCEKL